MKTREVMVLNRDPWELELYQLKDGELVLVGRSKPGSRPAVFASVSLPISLQLKARKPRPTIVVTHTQTKQVWTV